MTMQIYNLKNDRDIARHCSLDFSDKIYLKFNKRHSVENYIHIITGKTPERGAIDILMRIARYRPATERERCIRIEFLELPFPKDAINR